MPTLKTSYALTEQFGELYTGGIVDSHPTLGLLCPKEDILNTIDIYNSGIEVEPLEGVSNIYYCLFFSS